MSSNRYFEDIGAWPRGSIATAYAYGFIFSLALALGAFLLVMQHVLPREILIPVLLLLACLQFVLQMVSFLHIGEEIASRERLGILLCALLIILILVAGSIWIMLHLDGRMMVDPQEMQVYMQRQQGI